MKKIPPRFRALLFSFLMATTMACLMSGLVTFVNTGLADGFLLRWMKAYAVAFSAAFPLLLILSPLVGRLTDALIETPKE